MAEYVTKKFLKPVFLEYEKTYVPYLLLKKTICWVQIEPGLPPKLHLKGISVRRDFAPDIGTNTEKLLNALIIEQNVELGCDIVQNGKRFIHG